MQAGLSWLTVLKKRDAFRLFCNQFDPAKLVLYNEKTIDALMQRSELIRNRAKLKALVENARACLVVSDRHGSFSDYVWQFVDAKVVHHHFEKASQIPSVTSVSLRMAKQMQQDGFRFVGGKVCYAFMQASGMVNDHTQDCFCYAQICSS
jgi:DNA-3-methyladenine glycosylase I